MTKFTGMFVATAGALIALSMMGGHDVYAQAEVYGTMMVVKGDIKVNSTKSGKMETAKVGFKVYAGDAIQSGADSRAKIIMSDKNVINVSPDSKVTIAKYENNPAKDSRNVELKVDYGKVRASVEQQYDGEKNKFNVRTPTAVAGVRGTDFVAGFNPTTRQTTVVTFTGVVAVGSPGANGSITNPVYVRPGQSTSVNEGQKAETPKVIPSEQLNMDQKESSADTAQGGPAADSPAANAGTPAKDQEPKKEDAKADASKPAPTEQAKSDSNSSNNREPSSTSGSSTSSTPSASTSTNTSASPNGATPSGTPASKTAPTRNAASIPTVSMIDSRDLDTNIAREIKAAPELPKVPPTYNRNPTSAPIVTPTPNPFVDNAIRNQKSRVRVEICLPGTGC